MVQFDEMLAIDVVDLIFKNCIGIMEKGQNEDDKKYYRCQKSEKYYCNIKIISKQQHKNIGQ